MQIAVVRQRFQHLTWEEHVDGLAWIGGKSTSTKKRPR